MPPVLKATPKHVARQGNEAPIHSAIKCQRLCDQLDQRAGARGKNREARPYPREYDRDIYIPRS
jgi:hypothetical protein